MNIKHFSLLVTVPLLVVYLFAGGGSAYAVEGHGTPDEEPPAAESVCDDYTGNQRGLCNAYCEAMDCDSTVTQASDKACDRVLDMLLAIDPEFPYCGSSNGTGCPCADGVDGSPPLWNITSDLDVSNATNIVVVIYNLDSDLAIQNNVTGSIYDSGSSSIDNYYCALHTMEASQSIVLNEAEFGVCNGLLSGLLNP